MFNTKTSAAALSVASNSLLIILKVVVGVITGSVSIIAEAVHSALDWLAAVIALFSVRYADRPADGSHPFGHGKIENISGAVEAFLIVIASIIIIKEATDKIFGNAHIVELELGILVMLFSMTANILVSRKLYRVAKSTDSLALEADAGHLSADVYSCLAVVIGLFIVRLTDFSLLDPIVAIVIALYILKIAFDLLKKSFGGLMDEKLPREEEAYVSHRIMEHSQNLLSFHDLKTRKVGSQRYIELHLVMYKNAALSDAHVMCDHIEADIKDNLPRANITIHVEPCQDQCGSCRISCPQNPTKTKPV